MRISTYSLIALALVACTTKTAPVAATPAPRALDIRPVVGETAAFTASVATTFTLDNGLTVWHLDKPGLPLISLRLVVPGGKAVDPADAHGLTAFSDDLLTRGAGDRDATAFAQTLEELAIDLDVSTGPIASWMSLDLHADQFGLGLSMLQDVINAPRFDEDAVERAREQRQGMLAESQDDPRSVASTMSNALFYGDGHPLAHASIGDAGTLSSATSKQLAASWTARAVPSASTVVVVGAIDEAALREALSTTLGAWTTTVEATPLDLPAPAPAAGYYFIDEPGAAQSVLRVLMPGPAPTDAAYAPGTLAGVVLGGTFTSRLNRLLREEKGYSYGARANLTATAGFGTWLSYTSVRTDTTPDALSDLLGELKRMDEGINAVELKKAQGSSQTRLVGAMESVASIADTFATEVTSGHTPDQLGQLLTARLSATEADVDAASPLPLDQAVVLVVGDLATVREGVEAKVPGDWKLLVP